MTVDRNSAQTIHQRREDTPAGAARADWVARGIYECTLACLRQAIYCRSPQTAAKQIPDRDIRARWDGGEQETPGMRSKQDLPEHCGRPRPCDAPAPRRPNLPR